ncbi:MAG: heavy metal-binding domain-containing protein [Rhodobacteraceae bacterium]|nr:heavy metal-binding domain-containing protein [Paracoccaceae bacterium]
MTHEQASQEQASVALEAPGIRLLTIETPPPNLDIEIGEMVAVSAVHASNLIRDVREMITNALGGRMRRYERLLDAAMTDGLARFRAELSAKGYDGALGVRFAHPTIVQGAAELVIYGTGFRYRRVSGSAPTQG